MTKNQTKKEEKTRGRNWVSEKGETLNFKRQTHDQGREGRGEGGWW